MNLLLSAARRLRNLLFGYDFFISYAHNDGKDYAVRLERALNGMDFATFRDESELDGGGKLSRVIRWTLRRTRCLVVVGTTAALERRWIADEINIYRSRRRTVVPIDIHGIRETQSWFELDQVVFAVDAHGEAGPSDAVLADIARGRTRWRTNILARWALGLAIASLVILAVGLAVQTRRAFSERDRAEAASAEALAHLYTTRLQLADRAWEAGDDAQVRGLLDAQLPSPGSNDLRGFEWFYLWRLSHALIGTVSGEGGWNSSVSISPDGSTAAFTIAQDEVVLWDMKAHRELRRLNAHLGEPLVSFSPDGRWLAAAGWGRVGRGRQVSRIALFGVKDSSVAELAGDDATPVNAIAFAPTGLLATGSRSGLVTLWDAARGEVRDTLRVSDHAITSLAFLDSGRMLAAATRDSTVQVWSVSSRRLLVTLSHDMEVGAVAASLSRPVLAVVLKGELDPFDHTTFSQYRLKIRRPSFVSIWRLDSLRPNISPAVWRENEAYRLIGHTDHINSVALSSDGRLAVSGGDDRQVKLWDVENGVEVGSLQGHKTPVLYVAIGGDGRTIASASADDGIPVPSETRFWDVARARQRKLIPPRRYPTVRAIAQSSDGRRIAMAAWDGMTAASEGVTDATLDLRDAETGALLTTQKVPRIDQIAFVEGTQGVAYTTSVFSTQEIDQVMLSRLGAGSDSTIWGRGYVRAMTFAKGLGLLAVADDTLITFPLGQSRLALPRVVVNGATALAATTGARVVAVGDDSGRIVLFTGDRERSAHPLGRHSQRVNSLEFSPDGASLLSSAGDPISNNSVGEATIWDCRNGTVSRMLVGHEAGILSAGFSPDGRRVVTGSKDGTIRLWNTTSVGSWSQLLWGPSQGDVKHAEFSRDGSSLLSLSDAGFFRWSGVTDDEVLAVADSVAAALPNDIQAQLRLVRSCWAVALRVRGLSDPNVVAERRRCLDRSLKIARSATVSAQFPIEMKALWISAIEKELEGK